jgi:uncharacterized membrane protein
MNHQTRIQAAVAGIVALGLRRSSRRNRGTRSGHGKMLCVAKAGQNDCGTAKHACAAQGAKMDNDRPSGNTWPRVL